MTKVTKCSSCGAPIEMNNSQIAFCQYCGSPLSISDDRSYRYHEIKDGNRTYHEIKDKTYRKIVDSDVEKVRADYAVRMREMELREKEGKKKNSVFVGIFKWLCIAFLGFWAIMIIFVLVYKML